MKDNSTKEITAEEFDQLADSGSEEIDQYLDWSKATRHRSEMVQSPATNEHLETWETNCNNP